MSLFRIVRIFLYLYILKESVTENITRNQNGITKRLPDITSLCPYNQFCQSSPSKIMQTQGLESCCEKCSCKSDCHETGSCCFDAHSVGSTTPKYPCVQVFELAKQVPGLSIRKDSVLRFHVITNCSDNSQEKKYQKCNQPIDIEDFVIVSDPQTGKVYRNKHCAECNDVHTYEDWIVKVDCLGQKNIFHLDSFEEKEQYLQENCTLLSYPPDGRAGSMSHCIPNVISKCNTTGRWDTYDEEILEACNENRENQNSVFRSTDPFTFDETQVFYSSVYCYLCNEPKSTVRNDECKVMDPYSSLRRGGLIRIMGKLESLNDETNTNGQKFCKSFDIWDPFKKICRQLMCPRGKKPLNGRCIGLLSNIVGLAYSLNIEITFVDGQRPEVNLNLLSNIEMIVFSKLGNNLKCGKCATRLLNHTNFADSVFLQLDFFTTEFCSNDALLRSIRKLAGKEKLHARLRNKKNIANIELEMKFQNFYGNESFNSLINMKYNLCFSLPKVIDSTISQQCSRIMISKEEADVLGYDTDSSTSTSTSDPNSLPICLDTYFSKYSSKSGASSIFLNSLYGLILWLQASVRLSVFISIFVEGVIW